MEGGQEVTLVFTLVREDEGLEQVTDSGKGEEARLRDVQGCNPQP